jgi:hypothetical protein
MCTRSLILALALGVAIAAAAEEHPRVDPRFPEPTRRMLDSLMALPDEQWEVPPGVDRKTFIELMRRMARAPDSMYVGPDSAHRSDADMRRFFDLHEKDFVRLVGMFEADSTVERITGPDFPIYRPPSGLPPSRQKDYDALMHRLSVVMLVRNPGGLIQLRTTTVHTFDRRGYAHSRRPPVPLVETETLRQGRGVTPVYRRIKGNWFTYYQEAS